jgi:hypothetical protein
MAERERVMSTTRRLDLEQSSLADQFMMIACRRRPPRADD